MSSDTRQWSTSSGSVGGHLCHCIGCCPKCGACRTAPTHTLEYCELLQSQRRERTELIERQRGAIARVAGDSA